MLEQRKEQGKEICLREALIQVLSGKGGFFFASFAPLLNSPMSWRFSGGQMPLQAPEMFSFQREQASSISSYKFALLG